MAHVKRRALANGKSAYLVRYRDPAGKERSRQFTRRVDAEGFLHSTEVAKRDGSWLDPARAKIRLRDWVVLWEPSTVNLSPSTKARQDGIVRGHIVPRFGDLPLARIENADVQAWVAELSARGLAPASVKKIYDVFAKCVQAAVDDQRLPRNPARPVRLPKNDDHEEMRFLSAAEVDALCEVIDPAVPSVASVHGVRGTALRRGRGAAVGEGEPVARCASRWPRVSSTSAARSCSVRPRRARGGASSRCPKSCAPSSRELTEANPDPDEFVFSSPHGDVLRVNNFRRRVWDPAVVDARLGNVRIHDLRHTAISLWIAAGLNPKEVSVRAGHSNVAFTLQRYGHLYPESEDRMADALDTLDRRLAGGDEGCQRPALRPTGPCHCSRPADRSRSRPRCAGSARSARS